MIRRLPDHDEAKTSTSDFVVTNTPSGLDRLLTTEELTDLVAYLRSMKGND
jgi:hypothetical protein